MLILAVDDDPVSIRVVVGVLKKRHHVVEASGGAIALDLLRASRFDVVVTDLKMPAPDGFAVLEAARALRPPVPVVVLTAADDARTAVTALNLGARDYVVKPASPEEVEAAVDRVASRCGISSGEGDLQFGLVGNSPAMDQVRRLVPLLSASRETVLVQGETGTGKDLLARALHTQGPRHRERFVVHNMAATPPELAESFFFGHTRGAFSGASGDHPGLFEQADGGTLFLDEIDSFPFHLQAKLLRILEASQVQPVGSRVERPIDVRVIAASAVDLGQLVARGGFRADLYYRLRQLEVALPVLRDRKEDIPVLTDHFVAELAVEWDRGLEVAPEVVGIFHAYDWPGNVRELRNAVRGAALLASGSTILPAHLPRVLLETVSSVRPAQAGAGTLREVEREHISKVLRECTGNQSRTARRLGIDRNTLARKIRNLKIGHGEPL